MIQVKTSGGKGGLPSDWTEEVTATAGEAIAKGDAIEYCAYPENNSINLSSEAYPELIASAAYSLNMLYRVYVPKGIDTQVVVQKKINDVYTTIQTITFSGWDLRTPVLSSDGTYLFIPRRHVSPSNRVDVYKTTDGNSYSFLRTLSPSVTTNAVGCAKLSNDDTYLMVGVNQSAGSPYTKQTYFVYKRNGDDFTEILVANGPQQGGSYGTSALNIDCTNDGIYWISTYTNSSNSGSILFIKRTGDSFAVINLTAGGYNVTTNYNFGHCAISPDGRYFSHSTSTASPYVLHYSFVNEVVTKLSDPVVVLVGAVSASTNNSPTSYPSTNGIIYSPSGDRVYIASITSPYFYTYSIENGVVTKLANPSTLPTIATNRVFITSNGNIITIIATSGAVYKAVTGIGDFIRKIHSLLRSLHLLPNDYGYYGIGIAKTAAAAGSPCTATLFKKINDAGV
jgi:hypothetical protein